MKLAPLLATLLLAACANPGIVQLAPDTYVLNRVDKGGIFGNAAAMQAAVIQEASDFAASKGKVAVPIAARESPMGLGRFASFEYQFRLADKDSPEAQKALLRPASIVTVENAQTPPRDVYAELLKLDDLRKRGVLTEAEFDAEKRKLLQSK